MTLIAQLQALDDQTLVLASTERVARHLKMQSALLQSVSGKRSWFSKGKIATVSQWVEQVWLDLLPDEQLLSPVQELAVVKGVADKSGLLPETMISSTSTARRIAQAYSQFIKFKLPNDPDRFRFKREYEVFWQWRQLIEDACRSDGCVFRAEMPGRVVKAIEAGQVTLPAKLILVGVLYMNPAEKALIDLLKAKGTEVVEIAIDEQPTKPLLRRAVTQADEFEHVATWVSETLRPYIDTPHAAPSMALLVPDMQAYQAPLIEALTLTVSPMSLMPPVSGVEAREPWDVSSGAILGSRPMIRSAMDILSLTSRNTDSNTFSRVLLSNWVGGSEAEGPSRALVDYWMRENNGLNMQGRDYLRAMSARKTQCTIFTTNFRVVLDAQEEVTAGLYPSEWAEFFVKSLKRMGWPEAKTLSSANYQTLEAWDDALKVFRSLDYQLGPCNYERAFMWLREVVDTRKFQPRLSHVAPVAIMSYEDAVGLSFDHVWIMGASNKVLPLPADPNPFLPIEMLAEAGVPEATGEGQLAKAQRVVQALMGISPDITVSSHEHDDRGNGVGASELFGQWPAAERCDNEWKGFIGNEVGALDREIFDPETVPAVSAEEKAGLTGGVSIFKNYAHEPFFAFACNRLKADQFPISSFGFDPRIQGTMLHLCLEIFWKEIRSQANLKAMDDEELANVLSDVVERASLQLLYKLQWRYGRQLIRLEQQRLCGLLMLWMEYEKSRSLPFTVVAFEHRTEVDVFGVPLTVTLDRVDMVEKTETETFYLLDDYKSGATMTFNALNAQSLKEPQLPIYATCVTPQQIGVPSIDGITLSLINSKRMAMHTRSAHTAHLIEGKPGKNDVATPSAWEGQVDAWKGSLTAMAGGFLCGNGLLSSADKSLPKGYEHLEQIIR